MVVCLHLQVTLTRFESEEDLGDAEHVDVGVVEGEVDDDQPCGAVDPQTLSQFLHRR